MSTLELLISTPTEVLVRADAASVRAEDESGGFGILPGAADFLTVLPASVVRWRGPVGPWRFCALRAGLMTVEDGRRVAVACREGIVGDDLGRLEAEVARLRAAELDADRQARVEQMRAHAGAVRQLMRYLRPGPGGVLEHPQAPRPGGGGAP